MAAAAVIALIVVGLPVGMLVHLRRNAHHLHANHFRGPNGVLYEHYTGGVQTWWQPQELLRRAVLIGMSVAASNRAALRSWLLGVGCAVIFAGHVWVKPYHGHHRGWRKLVLDPNAIETLTLFMLMIAAFTGVFLAEGEEDADGREVLDATGGGGGLLYWPLLATIVALAVPVGHEFLCAEGGVLRTYQRWALDA